MTTTTVHADGRTVEVTPLPSRVGLDVSNPKHDEQITVLLTPEQARTVAAALSPNQGGQWTRDDLPDKIRYRLNDAAHTTFVVDNQLRDALAAYLNTHHPKPDAAAAEWLDRALNNPDEQLVALDEARIEANIQRNRAERERDAAVARAEAAEKRHTWPKTTPTGHTYTAPNTYSELRHQHGNAAQAAVESWDADECPPEPTWEMVGIAHREVERLQCERDGWKARAEKAERDLLESTNQWSESCAGWVERGNRLERELAEFKENADHLNAPTVPLHQPDGTHMDGSHLPSDPGESVSAYIERRYGSPGSLDAFWPNTAPAVTRADIEKVIQPYVWPHHLDGATDVVMQLLSGDDPAVYVVRESDIAGVEVERGIGGNWKVRGIGLPKTWTAEQAREMRDQCGEQWIDCEVIARAIEAEAQSPDPVEAKARELYGVVHPDGFGDDWHNVTSETQDAYRRLALYWAEGGDRDE